MLPKALKSPAAGFGLILLGAAICLLQVTPAVQAGSPEQKSLSDGKPDAGMPQKSADRAEKKKNIERMRSRVRVLQAEIAEIRDNALDNNPKLEELLKKLVLTRNEIMEKNLERKNVDMQRLEEIEKQLQDATISPEKQKDLEKERMQMILGYRIAEKRTAQNETLKELRERFYTELMKAAKKENPAAEKKLDELNMLKHQLQFVDPEVLPEE
ncbi:MAG: hypothetical protein K9K62_03040 [Desulfobacteraceae bacterium]|nr:hypothetical protein [Desulfobacteraceae bacterium]